MVADANHSKTWNCQCDLSSDALVPSLNRHQPEDNPPLSSRRSWLVVSLCRCFAVTGLVFVLVWQPSPQLRPLESKPVHSTAPHPPRSACENKTLETIRREWLVSLGSFRSKIKDARISLFMFNYILYYFLDFVSIRGRSSLIMFASGLLCLCLYFHWLFHLNFSLLVSDFLLINWIYRKMKKNWSV